VFTGIVEEVGTLRSLRVGEKSAVLDVAAALVTDGAAVGDSILSDGVCLTITGLRPGGFTADVMPETVRRTTLADRRPVSASTSSAPSPCSRASAGTS